LNVRLLAVAKCRQRSPDNASTRNGPERAARRSREYWMNALPTEFQPAGAEVPVVAFVEVALAPAVCFTCLVLCTYVYREPFTSRYALLGLITVLVSLRAFGALPLLNPGPKEPSIFPGRAIVTSWLTVICLLMLVGFATKGTALYSRKLALTWFAITPFALHCAQMAARRLLFRIVTSGSAIRSKVIVGVDETACKLARKIELDPCMGEVRGFFDDRRAERLANVDAGAICGRLEDVARYVKRNSINVVYITLPMSKDPRIVRLLDELRDTTASVYFVPNSVPFDWIQARVDRIGDIPVIALCETPFYGINGVLKRATDIAIASLILLVIWPLMLAIAVGIKRDSPGPVLFRQRRYGLDGKEIQIYKFRTMTVCEDDRGHIEQARLNDRRITRFGAFLRRTSLDELPQFINVVQGSMSIVGPRPHAIAHNEQYRRLIDGYMLRHKVRPGITGWAQINGLRGETETVEKMQERLEHDLEYLRHWALALDFWIMFMTVWVVLKRRNAY
jgi:Undecaprenyl-phosphate glucose phosphotransferase